MSKPWGWKVIIYVYGSGVMPEGKLMIKAANDAAETLNADDFTGVKTAIVKDKPVDSGGS